MYSDKPNEDFYVCDNDDGIYMVLDGISRDVVEGKYPNPSPARRASEIFADKTHEYLKKSLNSEINDFQAIIREAMSFGNECIADANSRGAYSFQPGTIGIVLVVRGDRAYYGFIGDCVGKVVSYDNVTTFTRSQTEYVIAHRAEYTQSEIRDNICNNPEHPAGYGALNGRKAALHFIETGCFELSGTEKILLYTDGFEEALDPLSAKQMYELTVDEAAGLSESMGSEPIDDRTLLIISCRKE